MLDGTQTEQHARAGTLAAQLLESPLGLLELLGAQSDALHVLVLARQAGEAKRDRVGR